MARGIYGVKWALADTHADLGSAMATWSEVESVVKALSAKRLNDTMWGLEFPIEGTGRSQQIYVAYEIIEPDMAFVRITCPLAPTQILNIEEVVRNFGSPIVGSLSYLPLNQGDGGFLSIGTSIPLDVLDLSQPKRFLLYMYLLSMATDNIKTKIGVPFPF